MEKGSKRAMITPEQIKKVWAAAHGKGMSEERLRYIVERISGRRSVRALTKRQARKVIDVIEGKAVLPVPKDNPNVIALATPGQLTLIEQLRDEAAWTDEHLMSFVRRNYKTDNLRKLTRSKAGIVIHVLEKEKKKRKGA